jgi:hypothetical protein
MAGTVFCHSKYQVVFVTVFNRHGVEGTCFVRVTSVVLDEPELAAV